MVENVSKEILVIPSLFYFFSHCFWLVWLPYLFKKFLGRRRRQVNQRLVFLGILMYADDVSRLAFFLGYLRFLESGSHWQEHSDTVIASEILIHSILEQRTCNGYVISRQRFRYLSMEIWSRWAIIAFFGFRCSDLLLDLDWLILDGWGAWSTWARTGALQAIIRFEYQILLVLRMLLPHIVVLDECLKDLMVSHNTSFLNLIPGVSVTF